MLGRTRSLVTVAVLGAALVHGGATATAEPVHDPFFRYSGTVPLQQYAPGDVLAVRTVPYHLLNAPTPLTAMQILYRSTDARGRPIANVTSVLRPPGAHGDRVVSYQSAYDSLNPDDGPSRAIAGNTPLLTATPSGGNLAIGGTAASGEGAAIAPFLALGYTVVVADTQGPTADFAAGPEYGMTTLDSLRAAQHVPNSGVTDTARIGLYGYSGGAIATNWASIMAPDYAPDVADNLIGAAQGGLLVDPADNLRYAGGSAAWGGVVGMAIVGIGRAYGIDFDPYINDYGREIMARFEDASILNVLGQYPGLEWADLVEPEYRDPNTVPEYVDVVNQLNMGRAPVPQIPMFVAQASNGIVEGTPPGPPGTGAGDGIMVAGDVRSLMTRYCDAGLTVQYDEYDTLGHIAGAALWFPGALAWLLDRFAGKPAPGNCGRIAPGNSLEPQRHAPR